MKRKERWKYFIFFTCCGYFCVISIHELWFKVNILNDSKENSSRNKIRIHGHLENDSDRIDHHWRAVGDTNDKTFVYSAYYDDRSSESSLIQVIGVIQVKSQIELMCRIYHSGNKIVNNLSEDINDYSKSLNSSNLSYFDVPAKISLMNEHHNLSYSACFISCHLDNQVTNECNAIPQLVSIFPKSKFSKANLLQVNDLKDNGGEKSDIGVCVKPIFSKYNNTLDLVEFIELNKILGVSQFTFYNQSMSNEVSCILDYYSKQEDIRVTVRSWKLRDQLSQIEIHDEAGMAALNDCLYRSMKDVYYLLMIDLDEYIVPHMNETLQDMLLFLNSKDIKMKSGKWVKTEKLASSYNFKNAFFNSKNGNEENNESRNDDNISFPLRVLTRTERTSTFNNLGDRSKYICIPHKVKEAGIHFVWEYQKGIPLHVPENMGFLHHYRNGCESHNGDAKKNCGDEKHESDKHLHKFKLKLLKNVETVWRKVSKNCNLYPW